MKHPLYPKSGIAALALAIFAFSPSPLLAEAKFVPLIDALDAEKRAALVEAEEAQLLIEGYKEFLADPEVDAEERPALRKNMITERARYKQKISQAGSLQVAIRDLRIVPVDRHVTLASLKEVYTELDILAAQGKAAWDKVLANRKGFGNDLELEYQENLLAATSAHEALDTENSITQKLLDATNSSLGGSTDPEFFVALKLPAIKSAVELGFRISNKTKDKKRNAQTTLIALVAYSQYFWDHYSGARTLLTQDEFPTDRRRNIFGVPNGEVLTSKAIAYNQSHYYYLAPAARERFNAKLRTVWGDGAPMVTSWNQKYDTQFNRACDALATVTEEVLRPNKQVFTLLEEIELLIAAEVEAQRNIAVIHANYEAQQSEAKQFGNEAMLSSLAYNAQIWSRESKGLLKGFEKGHALLAKELAASGEGDWIPNAKGISTSSKTIRLAQKRFYSVRKVKQELKSLLHGNATSEPTPEDPEPLPPLPVPLPLPAPDPISEPAPLPAPAPIPEP